MDGTFMIGERLMTDGEKDNLLNGLSTKISQLRERDYQTQGELLIRAKDNLKHGEWLDWLHDNISFSHRQAERLMRTAMWMRGKDSRTKSLPSTKVYILSRLTSDEYRDFLNEIPIKEIESIKKSELEILVRKYLKSHR